MGKERIPSAAEVRAQIPAARALAAQKRAAGVHVESAWYDPPSGRPMLALTDGVLVGIPVRNIPYLAKATPDQLKAVTLTTTGAGVCWDQLKWI